MVSEVIHVIFAMVLIKEDCGAEVTFIACGPMIESIHMLGARVVTVEAAGAGLAFEAVRHIGVCFDSEIWVSGWLEWKVKGVV